MAQAYAEVANLKKKTLNADTEQPSEGTPGNPPTLTHGPTSQGMLGNEHKGKEEGANVGHSSAKVLYITTFVYLQYLQYIVVQGDPLQIDAYTCDTSRIRVQSQTLTDCTQLPKIIATTPGAVAKNRGKGMPKKSNLDKGPPASGTLQPKYVGVDEDHEDVEEAEEENETLTQEVRKTIEGSPTGFRILIM